MLSDLNAIRARCNLASLVARTARLHPAGDGRLRCCCPFHDEKTPSFYVYDDGRFKCFGCGKSGDVFQFVQWMENLSFREAKELLEGARFEPAPRGKAFKEKRAKPDWRERLREAKPLPLEGTPGAAYLQGRGIPEPLALAAHVRFCGSWFNRASVLFPIIGQDGKTVAVQGRAIRDDAKMTLGPKTRGVFATPSALSNGILADGVAICEAPIDALSVLLLWDIPAIATCGSGLTKWIPSACQGTVWIATDADEQGDRDYLEWAPLFSNAKRLRSTKGKDWNEELLR